MAKSSDCTEEDDDHDDNGMRMMIFEMKMTVLHIRRSLSHWLYDAKSNDGILTLLRICF